MSTETKGLKPAEASQYLKDHWEVKHGTSYLAWLRSRGGGPRFYLIGRTPHYTAADLDTYGQSKTGPVVATIAEHRAAIANAA